MFHQGRVTMNFAHQITEDRYQLARTASLQAAESAIPAAMKNAQGHAVSGHAIHLKLIDHSALLAAQGWANEAGRRTDWNWTGGLSEYSWRHPRRFELAIWYRDLFLSGLSLGRPSWNKNKLRLDFIEASPVNTPLTGLITDIVLLAAEVYADAIGASELRIMNPINERVRAHYLDSKRGFSFDAKGNFCFKSI